MSSERIRVLIVDDHAIVRDGLRLILETAEDIHVVGSASDGGEALAKMADLTPDVMLLDLRMPDVDGLTVLRRLAEQQAQVRVVVLTTYNEPELMVEALQTGAVGYLLKDSDRETLFGAIRAAGRGESLLQPEILSQVMNQLQNPPQPSDDADPLTPRELEVLSAVAHGERNKEIAFRLGITERTVKAHLTHIYTKLSVDSRASAVAKAIQMNLIDLDDRMSL